MRTPKPIKPYESTEDFKLRLRALIGPKPDTNEKPCVRTPEDCGFYPPQKESK